MDSSSHLDQRQPLRRQLKSDFALLQLFFLCRGEFSSLTKILQLPHGRISRSSHTVVERQQRPVRCVKP